jgi:hypothetical protein
VKSKALASWIFLSFPIATVVNNVIIKHYFVRTITVAMATLKIICKQLTTKIKLTWFENILSTKLNVITWIYYILFAKDCKCLGFMTVKSGYTWIQT